MGQTWCGPLLKEPHQPTSGHPGLSVAAAQDFQMEEVLGLKATANTHTQAHSTSTLASAHPLLPSPSILPTQPLTYPSPSFSK